MPLSYSLQNGNGVTQNFVIPFSFLDRTHVHVSVGGLETNTFTWVNSSTVQITPAPASGTGNVKLYRLTPRDAAIVTFTNGNVLQDTDLNTAELQSLFIAQEYFELPSASLPSGHSLYSHTDTDPAGTYVKGTLLAVSNAAQYTGLAPGSDGQVLEADSTATKGLSWKQGLRNLLTTVGDILYASASGVAARLGVGTDGQFLVARPNNTPPIAWETLTLFSTGDVKLTVKTSPDSGWVMMNDGTIGDASSGATTRANADTAALFTLLWNGTVNADCAVSGGRGASAAADYAAHKTMALPKILGRSLCGAGAGSGLSSRALGSVLGSQDAVLIAHTHTLTDPGHSHTERVTNALYGGANASVGNSNADSTASVNSVIATASATTGITVVSAGSGTGVGANMQPSTFVNVMIKL